MFFHKTPRVVKWLYPKFTWSIPTEEKVIYLTFDDGPIPYITDFILETLSQYDAKATFFCVGENLKNHKDIAQRVIAGGHSLGNHTYNHLNGWNTGKKIYLENVEACKQELIHLDYQSKLYRPPYGKVSRRQRKKLLPDYEIIMWDVLTGDYSNKISKEQCLEQSIKATQPGSIVLFHDNVKAEKNLRYALPAYVAHFHNLGFEFKSICPK